MVNIILIILALTSSIFISSLIFWNLLNRRIRLLESIKLVCTATSLNRLILTGSGYAAMSYKLKKEHLPLHKSISSFVALELLLMLPWLALGIYFGFNIAVKVPVFFAVFLAIGLVFAIYKKEKAVNFAKEAWLHFKGIKSGIFIIIPLVLLHLSAGIIYYFFLFKVFGFTFPLADILKIATVSVAIGYFSPAPGGLGFKESGLVFLLMQKNISFRDSLSIAVTDRAAATAFYLILGFLFGTDLILKEIRARFKRNNK